MGRTKKTAYLSMAVALYLMGTAGTIMAQGPLQTTQMVNPDTNLSTSSDPYNSIIVTQASAASSVLIDGRTVYVGIGNDQAETLAVYLSAPASGSYNVSVSNNGSAGTGRVMAAGVGSLNEDATTNIHGPLLLQVAATAAGEGRATAEAIGIGAGAGTVTAETFNMSVKATGGASYNAAKAIAHGISNGNDNDGVQPVLNLGTANGSQSILVAATGGIATGTTADISATAYAVENYGELTLHGTTAMSVQAKAGSIGSGGSPAAGAALGTAYGLYNAGDVLAADTVTFNLISATGTVGSDTHALAYGLNNTNAAATVTLGSLTFSSITAIGGIGTNGNAEAYGIDTESAMSAGTIDMTVTASGGVGKQEAKAEVYGIKHGEGLFTSSGTSQRIDVSAIGGQSISTDGSADVSAAAIGLDTMGNLSLAGTTGISAKATGGTAAAAQGGFTYTANDAHAEVTGFLNHGENTTSTLDKLFLTNIAAKGGTGLNARADAYGLANEGYEPVVALTSLTAAKISAVGGYASAMGDAGASAFLVQNGSGAELNVASTITGTVEAIGGHGPAANTSAYAIENYGTVTAANVGLTSRAAGGWGSDEATADARGIVNYDTLTLSGGANQVDAVAHGGTSLYEAAANAVAQGIYNAGVLNMTGPATVTVQATGGQASEDIASSRATDVSAAAYGLYNQDREVIAGDLIFSSVVATGGTGDDAYAEAWGIYNEFAPDTIQAGSITMNLIKAQGGTGASTAYGRAYGIQNRGSALAIQSDSGTNLFAVEARGGTVTDMEGNGISASGEAYGITNSDGGAVTLKGTTRISVTAAGGTLAAPASGSDTSATAVGLQNESAEGITVQGPLEITATAQSGISFGENAKADAAAIDNTQGIVQMLDNVNIVVSATADGIQQFRAGALYASGGTINVGTDGQASLGKKIELQGDIGAKDDGSLVNVMLDQPASYLQGNVAEQAGGVVNLTVSHGATWKPVYDNRYGSFYDENDINTFSKQYFIHENSLNRLTLSDGGIVDLAWDDATRDPFVNQRILTISTLTGDGGIFKLHSNLAHNTADQISIGAASTAQNALIDVTYDPALASPGLTPDTSPAGEALVVNASPLSMTFTGKVDSYNLYTYTPQLRNNNDGTWTLTSLHITNVEVDPGGTIITSPSAPVRDAGRAGAALHDLFVHGELNNLQKRLGDLRAAEPAADGIWARYEHNKLERDDHASLKYNLFQLGYDHASAGKDNVTYRGAAFSYAKGTGTYEIGSGDVREGTLSLYQTGIRKNGGYYDIILKGGRLSNRYDLTETTNVSSADYHTWGYSLSGEIGRRIRYDNGLYVEPQAELTLGRINGADYKTSTGMNVSLDGQNIALARIGAAIGKELKNGSSYYAKASFYHDFGKGVSLVASDATGNSISYKPDTAKNWGVLSLGGTIQAGHNCNIYGEVSKYIGQLTNNVQFNVGARWKI